MPPSDPLSKEDLSARYKLIMNHTRDSILFVRRRGGKIIEANTTALKTYGYSREELLKLSIYDLRDPAEHTKVTEQLKKAVASDGILFETVHICKNGQRMAVEVSSQGAQIGNEHVLLSIVRDITERKKVEERLRHSEENMRALLNASGESFFLMDPNGIVLEANEAVTKQLGFKCPDQIIGKNAYDSLPPKLAHQRRAHVEKVILTGKSVRFEDRNGDRRIDQVIYPLFDDSGRVSRLAVFGTDITAYRKLEEKLHVQALTDQLTGLYNRRGFYFLAERQVKIAKRSGQKIVLFYIDLDGMKQINDTQGHAEGDKALFCAAQILRDTFREADILARIGGDEFAVLAVNIKAESKKGLVDRLHTRIDEFNSGKGRKKFRMSMSIGIAEYRSGDSSSLHDLISKADKLMYAEKKKKKELETT